MNIDARNFAAGIVLPSEGYCDQPYVVITKQGSWLCVMTTGAGVEGEPGQHVISISSSDRGRTWSDPVDVEPATGPEASWAVPLIVPSGRIYVLYTYNDMNMRSVAHDDGETRRVDTLGAFAFRYSDDDGNSWSAKRYTIPVREFEIDNRNPYGGEVRFWWSVSKPLIHQGAAYVGFAKVGRFGHGFMAESEGAFLKSTNILTEEDAEKIVWETLPDGEIGLRAPAGPVADEHNIAGLSDGSLYCTYRTIEGYNCHAYSRDGGHTWTEPTYAVYTPGGRRIKHPRAANFVRKLSGGRYILWYHNKRTCWYNNGESRGNRNIAWLCGGKEEGRRINWGQPEIVMYNDQFHLGSSYPDFVEEADGSVYVFSTQKTEARSIQISPHLLEGLWNPGTAASTDGLILSLGPQDLTSGSLHKHSELPRLQGDHATGAEPTTRGGISIDLWINLNQLTPGQIIVSNRDDAGVGFALLVSGKGSVRVEINDGWMASYWDSDPGLLGIDVDHHIAAIVDGGPKTISFVIDGTLCDGGATRLFGYGRFSPSMKQIGGSGYLRIGQVDAALKGLRLYKRAIRTAEAVASYLGGCA